MLRPVGSEFNCSSLTCLTMCGTSTGSALPSPSLHFSLLSLSVSLLFEQFNFQFDFIVCRSCHGYKSPAALTFRSAFCTWLTSQCHLSNLPPLSSSFCSASSTLPYTCFTVGHFIFSFQRATAFKSIKNLFKSPSPSPNGVSPVCGLFSSINLSCPSALAMCALPCAAFRHTCFIN